MGMANPTPEEPHLPTPDPAHARDSYAPELGGRVECGWHVDEDGGHPELCGQLQGAGQILSPEADARAAPDAVDEGDCLLRGPEPRHQQHGETHLVAGGGTERWYDQI